MDLATNLMGPGPVLEKPAQIVGTHWSGTEEGMLQALVNRSGPKRKSADEWDRIAAEYSRTAVTLGFPTRTGSGCRNKWRVMSEGVSAKPRVREVEAVRPAAQSSFAPVEIRNIIADAFEDIAKRLRGMA